MDWVYLDHNATTAPAPEVVAVLDEANRALWANPSSVHRFGQSVRQRLELARASVARLIGATPRELVFTSGGTESNNLALRGTLLPTVGRGKRAVLLTTGVEHAAVREPAEQLEKEGVVLEHLKVDSDGVVKAEVLAEAIDRHVAEEAATVVVSLQWANNETGVIQPMAEIGRVVSEARVRLKEGGKRVSLLWHVDGTQAVGKLLVDVSEAGIDLMTFAGHKLHGPKGVGVLYVRRGVRMSPQQRGGPQETDRRGGTENTPGILGFGVAAELAEAFLADTDRVEALRAMRDGFERAVVAAIPGTVVNAAAAERLWNTTSLAFPGIEAEAILLGLSEQGVCASAGAACSSGSLEPSPVLLAMGMERARAHGSVRLSMGRWTTQAELDRAVEALVKVVERLRQTMPMATG
ncbi:cysteine desulfurase family protein [Mucisphaera sp.]|uniref:cysteine desulfurase family protein n=1 Tax=Mucisphaera sp. TaxID=2913024 RepID=UPI003D09A391